MPQALSVAIKGLRTSPNQHGKVPAGSLVRAEDVVLTQDGVAEPRRGFAQAIGSPASAIFPYSGRLLLHSGSTLSYTDTGVTTKTDYAASIAAVTGRRLRAAAQNRNLYLATAAGVKRLDSVTGAPVDAGVPMGLDVQGALTGSSGFLPTDSAVAARVVWGIRDANGNLLLGAPSGRAVVANSAGASRDVIWSTSIPSGLPSGAFWQLYRTANSVGASVDPGDEMGLVYEGAVPQAAAVTQLSRTTNVVTATTSPAHGFSVGQIVRITPGAVIAGHGVALGTAYQRTTDAGASWSSAGITGLSGTINCAVGTGSQYVALGSAAFYSADGLTWSSGTGLPAGTYEGVCYTGAVYLAVASGSAAKSSDGHAWSSSPINSYGYWHGIAWNGSRALAVGTYSTGSYFQTADASGAWGTANYQDGIQLYAVTWHKDRWVAVGRDYATGYGAVYYSTEQSPTSWIKAFDLGSGTGYYKAVVSNGGTVIAAGSATQRYSADGVSWSNGAASTSLLAGAWFPGAFGRFVVAGTNVAQFSNEGTSSWDTRTITGTYNAVALSGGASFAASEFPITGTPTSTTFTYAETGADGTIADAITAAPLSATVVDQIPSTFAGATLYTSQSQDGILASQYEPPLCKDLALYRGSIFWLGTTDRALLDFWLLAGGAPSGVQTNDTVTINGTVFTAKTAESVGAREFKWYQASDYTPASPSLAVRDTAASLIRIINRAQGSPVYARDSSSANEQPGHISLTARVQTDTVSVSVSRSSAFALSSGTTKAPEFNAHRLAWSQDGRPDAATVTGYQDIGSAAEDGLRAVPTRDSLFVLKKDGIWRCTGDRFDHQTPPTIAPFDTTTAVVAPESVAVLDNVVFALSTKGIVQISDTGVTIISKAIEDQIAPLLVEPLLSTVRTVAHGVAYESDGKYILWVPTYTSDTQATKAFVYDHFASLQAGEPIWTTWTIDTACGAVNPADGKLYLGTTSALLRERKVLDFTDFADGEVSVTVNSATGTSVTLASASGVAPGDMIQNFLGFIWRRGVVLAVNSNTLTLDRTWTGGTGAATVFKAIPTVIEFAPLIPAPGAWCHFQEATFLFRQLAGAFFMAEFATELTRVVELPAGLPIDLTTGYAVVPFYGYRDYNLREDSAVVTNLRTWVTREQQKAGRLMVRFSHAQAMCPFALEGLSVAYAPMSVRVRR